MPSEASPTLFSKVKRFLPWGSLIFGLVSAYLMDRSPKSAWLMVALSLLGFAVAVIFTLVQRLDESNDDEAESQGERASEKKKNKWIAFGKVGATLVSQSVVQNCLLFSLPLYVRAAALDAGHLVFLSALFSASVISLWDPLYEFFSKLHAVAVFFLQSFATFVTLNAVLAPLGLSNTQSLFAAAAASSLGVPIFAFLHSHKKVRAKLALILLTALCTISTAGIFLGGARLVPAAPYRIVKADLGSALKDRGVKDPGESALSNPKQLVCATSIAAPRGISDKLFHVWSKNGKVSDRIALDVRGRDPKKGYFTYSRKKRLGKNKSGTFTCAVVTASGQLLGKRSRDVR